MHTEIVLGDFDKDGCGEVMVISECGFKVQKGFMVIAETFFGETLVVGDVAECVIESPGALGDKC